MSEWKVLLVDDEKDYLEDFRSLFSKKMNVAIASSASEAFHILKTQPIALILTDQRMPKVSGNDLLEEVAWRWPHIIRILLTGYQDVDSIIQAVNRAQIFQYISKDVSPKEIEAVIQKGMEKFEAEEKLRHQLKVKQEFLKAMFIEEKLLPEKAPTIEGLHFETYYQSAQEVGGDYFDFIPIDDRYLGIAVADVSGKGLQGAMLMSTVCRALRSQASLSLSPREVIEETEGMILPSLAANHFVTLFYAILDRQTMTLNCANAGHVPILLGLHTAKKIGWIHPHGHAVGIKKHFDVNPALKREECTVSLSPGDFIFFYTDGVTETRNTMGECFGRERLKNFFEKQYGDEHKNILEPLKGELESFSGGCPQQDDITSIFLERIS